MPSYTQLITSVEALDARLAQGGVHILEALPEPHYQAGHLPGARRVDLGSAVDDARSLGIQPMDPIVVYCSGPSCQNSHRAARELVAGGFCVVQVFVGGKQAWIEAQREMEVSHAA